LTPKNSGCSLKSLWTGRGTPERGKYMSPLGSGDMDGYFGPLGRLLVISYAI